jgi:hypothetical protein
MRNEHPGKSCAAALALAICGGLTVYVLSYQPLLCWVQRQQPRDSTIERIQSFYKPRFWLDDTPLRGPLKEYEEWVWKSWNPR